MIYNIRIKKYLPGVKQVTTYSKEKQRGKASPLRGRKKANINEEELELDQLIYRMKKSANNSTRRTVNTIYDIARSNIWEWFITFTFNPEKVDSFDYSVCCKKLKNWIDNVMRGSGDNVKYLAVPELHKSGRIHFHMLVSGINLIMTDSGHKTKSGLPIYNLGQYRWGFTTAVQVYETNGISKYICKYITKELISATKGKRRYWASKSVDRPIEEVYYTRHLETNEEIYSSQSEMVYMKQIERKDTEGKTMETIKCYEFEKGLA
jgi:hypothetical protein